MTSPKVPNIKFGDYEICRCDGCGGYTYFARYCPYNNLMINIRYHHGDRAQIIKLLKDHLHLKKDVIEYVLKEFPEYRQLYNTMLLLK